MPRQPPYLLTPTAAALFREAKAWSGERWGKEQTARHFEELHKCALRLAAAEISPRHRPDLDGGTGLFLYPVGPYFLIYEPLPRGGIAIVALVRQDRDVPKILARAKQLIQHELHLLRESLQ